MRKNASHDENEEFDDNIDEILEDESVEEETVSENIVDTESDTDEDSSEKLEKPKAKKNTKKKAPKVEEVSEDEEEADSDEDEDSSEEEKPKAKKNTKKKAPIVEEESEDDEDEESEDDDDDDNDDDDDDYVAPKKKKKKKKAPMSKSTKNKIMAIIIACIVLIAGIGFTLFKIFEKDDYIIKTKEFSTKLDASVVDVNGFSQLFNKKTLKYSDEEIVKMTPFYTTNDKGVTSKKMFDGKDADIDKALELKKDRDLELFKYFFQYAKSQYDNDKADFWTKENNDDFKKVKNYASNMVYRYNLPYMLADSMGLSLTEEDYTAIKKQMDEEIAGLGGRETFDEQCSDKFLSYELYSFLTTTEYLEQKVFTAFQKASIDSKLITSYYDEHYVLVKHVLLTKAEEQDESGKAIDEATIKKANEEAKKTAELVFTKAKANESFEDLIKKYNKDPGMTENPEGYFVTNDNSYVKEFQDAALKLKVGEISDVVETDYGWHVLKRVDPAEFYKKNLDDMKSEYFSKEFSKLIAGMMEDFEKNTEFANYYDKITPTYFSKKSK